MQFPDLFSGLLKEAKVDVLLVTNLVNIRYLTGFTGSNALLAIFPDRFVFWTDPRYRLQAANLNPKISTRPLLVTAEKYLSKRHIHVGFEREQLRFNQFEMLKRLALRPISGFVENLRAVKSPQEIAKIRRAVHTNSAAFERALKSVKPGMRESDLAALIDYRMRLLGAESSAFETIVAAGAHSALPHARPESTRFAENQMVLVDMGCKQDGYTSDMSRMFHLGDPPAKTRRLYKAVLEAQLAALDAVKPGVTGKSIDRAARKVLEKHGLAEKFVHSTGHGLGLEIHEDPRIGRTGTARMAAGMVITIEPGIYIEGWGGIRIEDTVVVTPTGCEVLTPTSKELRVVNTLVT